MRALRFVFGSGIIGGDYFSFTFFLRKVEIRQELERFSIEVTKAKKFFIPFFQKKKLFGFQWAWRGRDKLLALLSGLTVALAWKKEEQ